MPAHPPTLAQRARFLRKSRLTESIASSQGALGFERALTLEQLPPPAALGAADAEPALEDPESEDPELEDPELEDPASGAPPVPASLGTLGSVTVTSVPRWSRLQRCPFARRDCRGADGIGVVGHHQHDGVFTGCGEGERGRGPCQRLRKGAVCPTV